MPLFKMQSETSKQSLTLSDDDIVDFLTGKSSGKYVSATEALKNSDIFSLISQLSADLALVKYQADTSRAQSFLDNPSKTSNGFSFWQGMFAQLLLDGNSYAYRWRNSNGVDLYWEFLKPSQVQVELLQDGSGLVYDVNFDEPSIGYVQNISQNDMIHFRLMSNSGGKVGISPLTALANELNIKDSSNRLTLHALDQSIEAPGILTIQGGGLLNWKKKAARSREFVRQANNSNYGPIVLDDLESYQPLEVKSDVAKLLSQADWTGKQIAKVYGIPDSYINGQGDQQSSLTQIGGQYAKSLNRYVGVIEGELENKLNAEITSDIRPAIDAMGDDFATTISNLISSGTLSKNQGRYILQQYGYLPMNLPNEGGENRNEESSNEGRSSS